MRYFGAFIGGLAAVAAFVAITDFPFGEANSIDYQMADLLADEQTEAGGIARNGLADGYLSAREAKAMWGAYRQNRAIDREREKRAIIRKWSNKEGLASERT